MAVRRLRFAPVAARAAASSRAAARRPCSDWPHALVPALVLVLAAAQAVALQWPPSGPAVASAAEAGSMREAPSPRAARRPCAGSPRALVPAPALVLAGAQVGALPR